MKISEVLSETKYIMYFFECIKLTYKPKKLISFAEKQSTSNLLLFIVSAYYSLIFIIFNNDYSFEKQIRLSFNSLFLSLIFLPSVIASISFRKKTLRSRVKTAFYISINFIVFYLSIPITLYIIFIKTEKYFYYYSFWIGYFIIWIFCIVIFPILINTSYNRIFSTLLSIFLIVIMNITINLIISNGDNNILEEFDPIIYENNSKRVMENAHIDFLSENGQIIVSSFNNYLDTMKYYYLENIMIEEKTMDLIISNLQDIESKITFKTNQEIIKTSKEKALLLKKIIVQTTRIKKISDELPEGLKRSIAFNEEANTILVKNKELIKEELRKIQDIENRIKNNSNEITNKEAIKIKEEIKRMSIKSKELDEEIEKITELLEKSQTEMENTKAYIDYLQKVNSVGKEVNIIINDYNIVTQNSIKAVERINAIYKMKIFLWMFP